MRTKKSPKVDLEKGRSLFFSIGLVLALGLVLAAFNYKTAVVAIPERGTVNWEPPEEIIIPVTRPEDKKPEIKPITIHEIVLNLEAGEQELDFSDYTDEIDQGVGIALNPILSERSPEPDEVAVVDFAEQMPQFPGGMSSLLSFISKSVRYPAQARELGTQGRVFVRFVVNTDGTIADAHVVRSVDSLLDAEALRVVRLMPRWKPGSQNGRPVRVNFTIPINFVLQ
ncbi:energy transducer TonB [Mangrovibacterium marinum]|nr:energy transducer TonB [Mangrovibacterium marinum]